jgi:sulfide dehydrogenase cytochrome subunit
MNFIGKIWLAGCLGGAVLVMGVAPSQASDLNAALLASKCVVCHGPGGASAGHTPKLTGMTAGKILESVQQFRSGDKASTIMNRISKGYTDAQIKLIANHLQHAK